MEFTDFIPLPLPLRKVCRTCLAEIEANFVSLEDVINVEKSAKIIEMLVSLGCVEELGDENWPHHICDQCATSAIAAYNFKLTCQKTTKTLLDLLSANSSQNLSDIDGIDIVHQDHEYELPFLSHPGLGEVNIMPDLSITPMLPEFDDESKLDFNCEIDIISKLTEEDLDKERKCPEEVKEKPYTCTKCPSTFTSIYGLNYHMDKHNQPKQKLCQHCGKGFDTMALLRQHQRTHKNARFNCLYCDKLYKSKQALNEHYRVAHSKNRYAYTCTKCKKDFTAKATLISHMKTHNEDRNLFSCVHCPKKFARQSSLRTHSELHTVEGKTKKYACNQTGCDKKYATKHSLLLHVSYSHKNDRPFICEICSKRFVTKSNLDCHKKTHQSPMCIGCGAVFNSKIALKNHFKEHAECLRLSYDTVYTNNALTLQS